MLLDSLLNPAVLFFFLGFLAVMVKSDLDIPQPIPKLFSIYLIFSIGFKGGVELSTGYFGSEQFITLGFAIFMAFVVPLYSFLLLKRRIGIYNAGAIASTYGSISAVTFITASAYLTDQSIPFGGHMVAAMALMEFPAIIVGVFLIRMHEGHAKASELKNVVRESVTNGSVFLILGSLIIGILTGEVHGEGLQPFTDSIFKGILTLFLLDMGILAGKRIKGLKNSGAYLLLFSIGMPLFNAIIGVIACALFGISEGNGLLLVILLASASYIAVPAAMRVSVPEANPGIYVPMSLALTFPFNIIIGIPLYHSLLIWTNSIL